jgi:hypothetical protein
VQSSANDTVGVSIYSSLSRGYLVELNNNLGKNTSAMNPRVFSVEYFGIPPGRR